MLCLLANIFSQSCVKIVLRFNTRLCWSPEVYRENDECIRRNWTANQIYLRTAHRSTRTLAGRLLAAGIDVITVDGIMKEIEPSPNASDISIRFDGALVNIQCKRPRSEPKLRRAVHDARKQLSASRVRKNLG